MTHSICKNYAQQPIDAVTPFNFHGHQVRVITTENGEPQFVLKDLCTVLEIGNARQVRARLDSDGVSQADVIDSMGRTQSATVVDEAGMYEVILRSDKPEAVEFRRWVTREVLPSIRKHGGYLTEQKIEEVLTNPDTIIRLATDLKNERVRRAELESTAAAQAAQIEQATPKVEAYDQFMDATGKYSVGAVAKILGTSQNKLFRELRNAGVLISKGAMRNTPYQQYMHHFEVKAHEYERSSGEIGCSYTTYVQPSGVDFIRKKLGYDNGGQVAA